MKRDLGRSSVVLLLSTVLTSALLVVAPTAAKSDVTLPAVPFVPCSVAPDPFCIESVGIQPANSKSMMLEWLPSPNPGPTISKTDGVVPGTKTYPGRWTSTSAFDGESYDGLYLEVAPANAFVPWIFVNIRPTYSLNGEVRPANSATSPDHAVSLNSEVAISFNLRVSNFDPGVSFGVGTDGEVSYKASPQGNQLGFFGYPVSVPVAANVKRDCKDETGVATVVVNQLQTVFVPKNSIAGFGDQTSGRLFVSSNGTCTLSTPTWIPSTKSFNFKALGPRLSPDRKSVNKGFYYASIPFEDAKTLWGLTNPNDAQSALVVSIKTTATGTSGAVSAIRVAKEHIIISVSGFEFPDPMIDVSLNPTYNSKGAVTGENNTAGGVSGQNNMSLSSGGAKETRVRTITCTKGNKSRKVSNVKPVCPRGWKRA